MTSENCIIPDVPITEELAKFHVTKLKKSAWFRVIILVIFPLLIMPSALIWLVGFLLITLIITVVLAPKLWRSFGAYLLTKIFIENFKSWKEKKKAPNLLQKGVNYLLSMKVSADYTYFLEADVSNINLNSIYTLIKGRIFNLTSACIGISFIIGTIIAFFISPGLIQYYIIILIMFLVLLFSPLFLFWLIPILWTIQDANINYISKDRKIYNLYETISKSSLKKILGITGITLAFSFFLDFSRVLNPKASTIEYYIFAGFLVFIVILLIGGTALLSGILYLNKYHENIVNNFRSELAKIIDVGVISIRRVNDEEKQIILKTG